MLNVRHVDRAPVGRHGEGVESCAAWLCEVVFRLLRSVWFVVFILTTGGGMFHLPGFCIVRRLLRCLLVFWCGYLLCLQLPEVEVSVQFRAELAEIQRLGDRSWSEAYRRFHRRVLASSCYWPGRPPIAAEGDGDLLLYP